MSETVLQSMTSFNGIAFLFQMESVVGRGAGHPVIYRNSFTSLKVG